MVHKAEDKQTGFIVALSLMAGGAIGNLIDRIAFGKVTDFVLWKYNDFRWPVFNIADIALSVAVGLFLIVALRDWRAQRQAEATS
jgi:signal peptidase II